jgi:hypothetical protein
MGALAPQGLEFAKLAPFKADASIVCRAPATAVFDVLRDHRRWPEWVGSGVTEVEPTSDPEFGVGCTRTVRFGRFAYVTERFIGWDEPTLWAFTATSFQPRFFSKLVERFEIEPIDAHSSRITYRMGADFPAALRPFGRLIIRFISRGVRPLLHRLSQEAAKAAVV